MGRFDFKTRTGQIFPIIQTLPALTFDTDAQAFFNRVTAAGGALNSTELISINDLVLNMKSAGIWNSMKAIYPMVGASAAACAQNLKSSSFTGAFSSGWTFSSTGATPNGTNAFMNTGYNPSLQTNFITNHHQSFYSRTQTPSGSGWNMGVGIYTTGIPLFGLAVVRSGNSAIYDSGSYLVARITNTQTDGRAFWLGSCTASNLRKFIKNGAVIATNTVTDTNPASNANIVIGALMDTSTGSPTSFMSQQCAFSSIGDALSDTQASDFYTAVQAFQTSLSRQV